MAQLSDRVVTLTPLVVTPTPEPRLVGDLAYPVSVLNGEELLRRAEVSLGETLAWEPGVTSTRFGAGASRPVIRGFDGDRVRVMINGIDAFDASFTSPDHGVAIEPALARQIEVVRGPGVLRYGSSAIGGVVNVLTYDLPTQSPANLLEGATEGRYDSVADGWTGVLRGQVGGDSWSVGVSGVYRNFEDYDIPGFAESEALRALEEEQEEEEEVRDTLENSFVESRSGSLSANWFGQSGARAGVVFSTYSSEYGVPGGHGHGEEEEHEGEEGEHEEEAVTIDLDNLRIDAEFELPLAAGSFSSVYGRFGYVNYDHVELEGEEVGTQFDREGWEARIEALHDDIGDWDGAIGMQVLRSDFSAEGEEAFTPPSQTTQMAAYIFQSRLVENVTFDVAARAEWQQVSPELKPVPDEDPEYQEMAYSVSVGGHQDLRPGVVFATNFSYSQRHPNSTELFANGPHAATQQFEIGNATLGREKAFALDMGIRRTEGRVTGAVTVFAYEFTNYIFGAETGEVMDGLDVFQFGQTDARFYGFESEATYSLVSDGNQQLDMTVMADAVRATDRGADQPLPRIPPYRFGVRVDGRTGPFRGGFEIRYTAEQDRVAPEELPTEDSITIDADLAYVYQRGRYSLEVFIRAKNLNDAEIRNHVSFLKDVAPLPGRNFVSGVRVSF